MKRKNIVNFLIGVPLLAFGMYILFGLKLQILSSNLTFNLDTFGTFQLIYVLPIVEFIIFIIIYFFNRNIKLIRKREIFGSTLTILYILLCLHYLDSIDIEINTILGLTYGAISLLAGYSFLYKSTYFLLPHDILVNLYVVHYNKNYFTVKIIVEYVITIILLILVKNSVIDIAFLIYIGIVYYLNAFIARNILNIKDLKTREFNRIGDKMKAVKKSIN